MSTSLTTSLRAGLQPLIIKTAVSLVNRLGDLGATLKAFGSPDALHSLATAIGTAGLTTQLRQSASLGIELPATAQFHDRLGQNIQQ